jgi:iron complex transport system ATP-binding protein
MSKCQPSATAATPPCPAASANACTWPASWRSGGSGGPGPRWLLLDEPTSALDLRHQHTTLALVRRLARNRGFGVCAVLHDINLALRYADDLLLLDRGRLATAGPIGSALREDLVSRVWGIEARLVQPAGVSSPFIHTEIPEPASDHERT